jgi:hypothetical protein
LRIEADGWEKELSGFALDLPFLVPHQRKIIPVDEDWRHYRFHRTTTNSVLVGDLLEQHGIRPRSKEPHDQGNSNHCGTHEKKDQEHPLREQDADDQRRKDRALSLLQL